MTVENKIYLATKNYLVDIELTSSIVPYSAYPLENLQSQNAGTVAMFDMTGEDTLTIQGTSGTEFTINSFNGWHWNLLQDASIKLQLFPDEAYGGAAFDTGWLLVAHTIAWGAIQAGDPLGGYYEETDKLKHGYCGYFDPFTFKSFKIIISAPTTHNNKIWVDKFGLWPSYEFAYGQDWDYSFGLKEIYTRNDLPSGGADTFTHHQERFLNLDFSDSPDDEVLFLQHMLGKAKMGGDILVSLNPNEGDAFRYYRSGIFIRNNDLEFKPSFHNMNKHMLSLREN